VTIDSGNSSDIWVLDLAGGGLTRVTTTGQTRNPSWSPDSRRVFYISTHGGRGEFWWQAADGSGPPVKAGVPPHNPWWTDVSPDGRAVIFNAMYSDSTGSTSWNLETLALEGEPEVREFVATPITHETTARFSPDGAFVAYASNDSGRYEVYVRAFAQNSARALISQSSGRRPIWSHDGTRIFYFDNRQLMSASIAKQPSLHVTSRSKLFEWAFSSDFDVAKDGRFLMIDQVGDDQNLVVVPNWRTELRRLVSEKGR
jgi:Tol biopolymer transport system component